MREDIDAYLEHGYDVIGVEEATTLTAPGNTRTFRRVAARQTGLAAEDIFHHQPRRHRPRLIETLPSLQHDLNRPEDVLKVDADEGWHRRR